MLEQPVCGGDDVFDFRTCPGLEQPELDFSLHRAEQDDLLGDRGCPSLGEATVGGKAV
jgi:hypothetical protein